MTQTLVKPQASLVQTEAQTQARADLASTIRSDLFHRLWGIVWGRAHGWALRTWPGHFIALCHPVGLQYPQYAHGP